MEAYPDPDDLLSTIGAGGSQQNRCYHSSTRLVNLGLNKDKTRVLFRCHKCGSIGSIKIGEKKR